MGDFDRSSMLEMFTYEMGTLLEQLEQIIIQCESGYSIDEINEIFRIMHTIKGSAAMMLFDSISTTAHSVEDLFYFLRENSNAIVDYSTLTDLVLEGMDFCKSELSKIETGSEADGDGSLIISNIKLFLQQIKDVNSEGYVQSEAEEVAQASEIVEESVQEVSIEETSSVEMQEESLHFKYKALIRFVDGCEMENIRAYTLVHNFGSKIVDVVHIPEDIISETAIPQIRKDGFIIEFCSELDYGQIYNLLLQTVYLEDMQLEQIVIGANENNLVQPTEEILPTVVLNHFHAVIFFEDDAEMENVRAYTLIHNIENLVVSVTHEIKDLVDDSAIDVIKREGFRINISTDKTYEEIYDILNGTIYLKELFLEVDEEAAVTEVEEMYSGDKSAIISDDELTKLREESKHLLFDDSNSDDNLNKTSDESNKNIDVDTKTNIKSEDVKIETVVNSTVTEPEVAKPIQSAKPVAPVAPVAKPAAPVAANPMQGFNAEAKVESALPKKSPTQHVISVNVSKLDQLLNLMGELVIAEAMVTQNPELDGLVLESFRKETRQLRKIITDVQNTVMSMRMISLSTTFFKMNRIVRDMCKQLSKEVDLVILGEDTEVDKNIIEHISDPIMHVIRNSVDHGIEMPYDRVAKGKPDKGTVTLEAKNTGGDVLIIVKDDGAGLNKDKILAKAIKNGLLRKSEKEYTDKEIYQFIFLPGFSTNEAVTNYSGRGVGMDVVSTNLEIVGGSVSVESEVGVGSTFTMKIPLTLAIIEGMTIILGDEKFTIPIVSIKQSFKAKKENVFADPDGNEMISVRGEVFNIVRLYEFFGVEPQFTDIEEGIIVILENGDQSICLFVDSLIGEQQVVVKTMPKYIPKVAGISGCTLLGNGDISLIIDVAGFFSK